jgi:hypothetical protein
MIKTLMKKIEIQVILRDLAPDSAFNPIEAWEAEKARRTDKVIGEATTHRYCEPPAVCS